MSRPSNQERRRAAHHHEVERLGEPRHNVIVLHEFHMFVIGAQLYVICARLCEFHWNCKIRVCVLGSVFHASLIHIRGSRLGALTRYCCALSKSIIV